MASSLPPGTTAIPSRTAPPRVARGQRPGTDLAGPRLWGAAGLPAGDDADDAEPAPRRPRDTSTCPETRGTSLRRALYSGNPLRRCGGAAARTRRACCAGSLAPAGTFGVFLRLLTPPLSRSAGKRDLGAGGWRGWVTARQCRGQGNGRRPGKGRKGGGTSRSRPASRGYSGRCRLSHRSSKPSSEPESFSNYRPAMVRVLVRPVVRVVIRTIIIQRAFPSKAAQL